MSPATPIANGAAKSRPSSHEPIGGQLAEQRLDAAPTPAPRNARARRACGTARRRAPLPLVLGAVGGQHHDAERRPHEVRLGPDRERRSPAEQLAGGRVAGDEPAAEHGHPGHRLELAQPVERLGPSVLLEVGELDRRAGREALACAPPPRPPTRTICGTNAAGSTATAESVHAARQAHVAWVKPGARTRRAPASVRVRGWRGSGRARRAAWRGTGRRRPGPGRWRRPRHLLRRTPRRRRPAPRRR